MKKLILVVGILCAPGAARGAESADLEALKRELLELRRRTEQLELKIESLERSAPPAAVAPAPPPGRTPDPPPAVAAPDSPGGQGGGAKPGDGAWQPTAPLQIGGQRNYINLSFDLLATAGSSTAGDVERLQPGGHDPRQRGFTLQNGEITLEGKVDPYFRGQANTVLFVTPDGETEVELEEAYLESLALPWNLQLKAGQFLTEFGRLNSTHPHTWDFVDAPLVNGRFFGEDGLRNPGARLSWLVPAPFYSELLLAIQNSGGETANSFRSDHEGEPFFGRPGTVERLKNAGDLLFAPRYVMSFDLSESQTLLAGASAAFGPNSTGARSDTQVYGIDVFWKWKPPQHHGGFPFVTWQTEAMLRRFEAGGFAGDPAVPAPALPGETLKDWGLYSQIAYGFRKGWVAALRWDYVAPEGPSQYEPLLGAPDLERVSRWRISPNLTWYPTEFSKFRLQYNFDDRNQIGEDHSVWLQFEFLLGSHAAHGF